MSIRAIGEGPIPGGTFLDGPTGNITIVYRYTALGDGEHQGIRYSGEITVGFPFGNTTAQIENAITAAIQADILSRYGVSLATNEVKLL